VGCAAFVGVGCTDVGVEMGVGSSGVSVAGSVGVGGSGVSVDGNDVTAGNGSVGRTVMTAGAQEVRTKVTTARRIAGVLPFKMSLLYRAPLERGLSGSDRAEGASDDH